VLCKQRERLIVSAAETTRLLCVNNYAQKVCLLHCLATPNNGAVLRLTSPLCFVFLAFAGMGCLCPSMSARPCMWSC
jgi:hypothetical protein